MWNHERCSRRYTENDDCIIEWLGCRLERLTDRLGRRPSFLPVGREEVKSFCQWRLDCRAADETPMDLHDYVIGANHGVFPDGMVVHTLFNVRLRQI